MALEVQRSTPTPMYLNVYDLTPANGYFYWLGLGIYHSGLEGESTRIMRQPDQILLVVCYNGPGSS